MIDQVKAATIVTDTIRDGLRHKWYDRTVSLADLYTKLFTGEGAEDLLRQIVTRESEVQFKLRKKLFFPIPPAVCKKARVPFSKVPKADGVVEEITYDGKDTSKRKRLDTALDGFHGEENLDDFMADRYLDMNLTDPNSYVIVEFAGFDPAREVASPYPLEITSMQCINKGVTNNATEWIIGKFSIVYEVKKVDGTVTKMPGDRFVMYFGMIYDLQQIEFNEDYPAAIDPSLKDQNVSIGKASFRVRLLNPFSARQKPEFQGICTGHVKDVFTGGESFVSVLHNAKYRMLETLKSGSEGSLVLALTAHPQVFQYLEPCKGEGDFEGVYYGCVKGNCIETGNKCSKCGGSGKMLPTSVLDAMYFDLPDDAVRNGEQLMDLAKVKHYSAPDVAIIEALWGILGKLEDKCLQDIFTSVSLNQDPKFETATKVSIDEEAQNNAVYPYGRKWATVKVKIVRMVAMFTDSDKGLNYTCKVPSRLQLAPFEVIMERVSKAKSIGSPMLYDMMERDAVANKLSERPLEMKKYEVRKRFRPLEGITPEQKREFSTLISLNEQVMLAYENEIYLAMDDVMGFYYMEVGQQRELLKVKVDEIIARIKKSKAQDADFSELLKSEAEPIAA